MDNETLFRTAMLVSMFVVAAYRIYYHRKAGSHREAIYTRTEGYFIAGLRVFFGIPMLVYLALYIFNPQSVSWSLLPLSNEIRWFGLLLTVIGAIGIYLVNRALGLNFSTTLRIRDDHSLITSGPYRYVRHPMYTLTFTLLLAWFLLSSSVVFAFIWLFFVIVIMVARTPKEEAMMLQHFGEQYRTYMAQTGRFLPKLM